MEYGKRIILLCASLMLCVLTFAQTEGKRRFPLYLETSLEAGTPCKGFLPFGAVADLGYSVKRFSVFATAQADFFVPKEGGMHKYNRARNLGGGIGYVISPEDGTGFGAFALRASVTTSVGGGDFNNTSCKIGLQWSAGSDRMIFKPVVGVGYMHNDFRHKTIGSYDGAYVSLGIRF